ncbi:MAG: SsrA-binding protein SmpB [Rhodospirillales bacterium]|nr:SsrA-binding protein SmpB [Rhodospirillales bacterium]
MAGKDKGKSKSLVASGTVAKNRRARFDYAIEDTFEAGVMLAGTEVKSLRRGQASINEAYAGERGGELFLFNAHVPEYEAGKTFGHEPRRARKLLLHRREIAKLIIAIRREGMTLIPLSIYFNKRGVAKVGLALARGKQKADKRAAIKDRDWKRQKSRLLHARD